MAKSLPGAAHESELTYPLGEPPKPGLAVEAADGVLWLRMPMPSVLTHINLWALRDGDGWAIVDSGLQTRDTAMAWRTLMTPDGALGRLPITRVIATHMHPDHVGMTMWLTGRFNCRLWMTRLEYLNARALMLATAKEIPPDAVRFYRRAGWSDLDLDDYQSRLIDLGNVSDAVPDSFRRIEEGDALRIGEHDWHVVIGQGHSPEHACLYCPSLRLFISGDQVLPRISSNVSVYPAEPDADPMSDWLASLAHIRRCVPDDVLVLPAHNEPFTGLHARLAQLERSAHEGLQSVRARLNVPQRAIDLFDCLFRREINGDAQLLGMATGESLACINYLLRRGEAEVDRVEDGVAWFRLSSAGQPASQMKPGKAIP